LFFAVYLKKFKMHNVLGCMPYEALAGNDRDVSHLQLFGSFVKARKSRNKSSKENMYTSHMILLRVLLQNTSC